MTQAAAAAARRRKVVKVKRSKLERERELVGEQIEGQSQRENGNSCSDYCCKRDRHNPTIRYPLSS